MTKKEFLDALLPELRKTLPADEVVGAMEYYEECINDRMEDGLTEEEAVQSLGSIDDILHSEKAETNAPRTEDPQASREFHTIVADVVSADVQILLNPNKAGIVEVPHTDRSNVDVQVQNGVLTIHEHVWKRNGSIFNISFFTAKNDIVIYVSDRQPLITLRVSTVSGDITADGVWVERGVELKSTSGDIDLQNAKIGGDLAVTSRSGDLDVRHVHGNGNLQFSSLSGDIDTTDVCGNRAISLDAKSGDLDLRDVAAGNISAKTVSGDIDVHNLSAEMATLNTTSGDIEGKIADSPQNYTTQFSSVSGSVSSESGTGGSKHVMAKTVSGNIALHF